MHDPGTSKIDGDRGADNPGIGTSTADGKTDNPGKSIADIDVDRRAKNPGIRTIDVDRANNSSTDTNGKADRQATANNKTCVSLFFYKKPTLFWLFFLN